MGTAVLETGMSKGKICYGEPGQVNCETVVRCALGENGAIQSEIRSSSGIRTKTFPFAIVMDVFTEVVRKEQS